MQPTRRVLYAIMLAVASGLAACDRPDGLGDVTGPTSQRDLIGGSLDGVSTTDGLLGGGSKKQVVALKRSNALLADVTYVSEPVSRWGSVFKFGGHRLVIPAGAVRHPTRFSATVRAGDDIRLDLRAFDEFGAVTNFLVPVELTINVSDSNTGDLTGVSVFYLNPNGDVEQMPTTVDSSNRRVTGILHHFSDYIPGTLRDEPPPPTSPESY